MWFFRDFSEAEGEIRKALALDPSSADAHEVSCWFENEMGRSAAAIAECRRSTELDPLSVLKNWDLANTYYLARDYKRSIEQANKTLEIDPKSPWAVAEIGYVYEQMGNYKQAMEQWIKLQQLDGSESKAKELRQVFEKSGYMGYLRKDAKDKEANGRYYDAACDYVRLGEKDAAFAALEQAFAVGNNFDEIKLDPALDNIRSDPRYADLLRRIGLPQ